jgi:hypothetical protein
MKKTLIRLAIYFTVSVTLVVSSCAPAYIPNVINTPLLSNKGEFQAAVYTGTSGFDPQLAYAVSDHVGLMLNGSFASRTNDSTDDYHKHQFVEIGTGYYTKIGTEGRFETFGGFGYGKVKVNDDNDLWLAHSDVNSIRLFIQPAFGLTSDFFDGSAAMRFVFLDLYQGSVKGSDFFIEPVVTCKLGFKYVKAVFQTGFSLRTFSSSSNYFNYQPFIISIGLQANINKIFND